MSGSVRRTQRCMRALEGVLDFLRKKDDPDAHELAKRLENRFLSPSGILEANVYELRKAPLNESSAQFLSFVPNLTRYALRMQYGTHPRFTTLSSISEYLRTLYIGVPIEQFYLICLDASGRMLRCDLLQEGTIDETPFYLGHLLQSAVTARAKAVVLSHNHPGGTLRPSQADVKCTLDALQALYPLNILMLDHIIVADGEVVSLREYGYVSASLWRQQSPTSKLLIGWLN